MSAPITPQTVPQDGPGWDRLAANYDATRGGERFAARLVDDLLPQLNDREPILELAVGTGLVAQALERRGRTVIGIDLSAEMLSQARSRNLPRLMHGDGRSLPIRGEAVRTVVVVRLFQLVTDHQPFFDELARVLRPGGKVIITPVWDGSDTDPINRYYWEHGRPQRAGVHHLRQVAERAGLAYTAFVYGVPAFKKISPAEEVARLERLWQRPFPADHPLRTLPGAHEQVQQRVSYDHMILTKSGSGLRG